VISSTARLVAFGLLDADISTGEIRLRALVDAVCCVLAHDGRDGEETARLALEAVVHPAVARAAVRALVEEI